jgi:hypothetical protein
MHNLPSQFAYRIEAATKRYINHVLHITHTPHKTVESGRSEQHYHWQYKHFNLPAMCKGEGLSSVDEALGKKHLDNYRPQLQQLL